MSWRQAVAAQVGLVASLIRRQLKRMRKSAASGRLRQTLLCAARLIASPAWLAINEGVAV